MTNIVTSALFESSSPRLKRWMLLNNQKIEKIVTSGWCRIGNQLYELLSVALVAGEFYCVRAWVSREPCLAGRRKWVNRIWYIDGDTERELVRMEDGPEHTMVNAKKSVEYCIKHGWVQTKAGLAVNA